MPMSSLSSSIRHHLYSTASDANFKKSCEILHSKRKNIEIPVLNSILDGDNPDIPLINNEKCTYAWYFAIGSMINPVSLFLRHITPVMSYPAKCPNYRLVFRGKCGMADIEFCPGEEFHGVVHLLPVEQMIALDQLEHMYKRITVYIIDYQQRSHCVHVYKMNRCGDKEKPIGLPSERYVDIIVKGCEYFGVCSSHINRLKYGQEVTPRKRAADYERIKNIPDGIYYTIEELRKHNGNNSELPLWTSINGKILEYKGLPPSDHQDHENQKQFHEFVLSSLAGREISHIISCAFYEPMYKVALTPDDLSDEHRALAEDMCVCWGLNTNQENDNSYWKPVGRLLQESENDKSL